MSAQPTNIATFNNFGDLLKFLRRREHLTQLELSIAVGYSEAQISRLEQNQRLPDLAAVKALFIPALGLQDTPETAARLIELAQSARQEDSPAPGLPPYKGLLYFDQSDSDLFFGRETLTTHLTDRITASASESFSNFLAVVGASGSGKSSLVRAGLAVTLKHAGWAVHIFTPTATPLRVLDSTLEAITKNDAKYSLMLVDQFEETFTLCRDESERIAFIERLLSQLKNSFVIITLRADFYSHCAQYPLLRQAVASNQEYIGQMTTAELRRAIEEPAKRGGWEFESGLVDLLLHDIGADGTSEPEPGALPLLSHVLLATWERRRGKTFTIAGYRASGGVRSAIAETAESVFTDQLNQQQQELARDVFLRLTELGEGTEDTRRRAALNELVRQTEEAAQLRMVLNTLAEARLITLNADSAEVAHEALIREWQRLHDWLTQDREGLRLHRHLTESAKEWDVRGRDAGELYRGARLAHAREWVLSHPEQLNTLERAFLDTSFEWEQYEALERETQRQRELESAKKLFEAEKQAAGRMKRVSILLAIVLAMSFILAGFVLRLNHLAVSRELAAASMNQMNIDPELSILLALEAVSTSDTREAEEALHMAVMESRIELRLGMNGEALSVAYNPDGTRVIAAGAEGVAKVWDTHSGIKIFELRGHNSAIRQAIFSPDGKRIATASEDTTVKVWDANTGELLMTLSGHTASVGGAAFSPDGKFLATASEDTTWRVWNVEDGAMILQAPTRTTDRVHMTGIVFSDDGQRIATTSWDGFVEVWDAKTGEQVSWLINTAPEPIFDLDINPLGNQLASTSSSNIRISDVMTGEVLKTIARHNNLVYGVTYSPDGMQLASGGLDGKIKIWDASTGTNVLTLAGHRSAVNAMAFSPDGLHVASASSDGSVLIWNIGLAHEIYAIHTTSSANRVVISADGKLMAQGVGDEARIWDLMTGAELFSLRHDSLVGAVAFSPDGKYLVTTNEANDVNVWEIMTQTRVITLASGSAFLNAVVVNPIGGQIASGGEEGIVRVWDFASGELLFAINGHIAPVTSLAYSPDGKWLASAGVDDRAILWDAGTGEKVDVFSGHHDVVWSVAFNSDGSRIVTASRDSTVKVWNVGSGEELLTLQGHTGTVVSASFSPDGKQIASAGRDGLTNLWDAQTGELLLTLPGDGSGIQSMVFTSDGKHLVTAGGTGLRIYVLDLYELIGLAESRLTREMTAEECQEFMHVAVCPSLP